jgi:hypothetical protein
MPSTFNFSTQLGRDPERARSKEIAVNIEGSAALVTGANRGIGQAIARALFERG